MTFRQAFDRGLIISRESLRATLFQFVFLVLAYSLLESLIETLVDNYWIVFVVQSIENEWWVILLALVASSLVSFQQVRAKNFILGPIELFLLFFYLRYRFFDAHWIFHPVSYWVTYFDLLPIFIFSTKIWALKKFLKNIEIPETKNGIIDPDLPLGEGNQNDELGRTPFANELVHVLKSTRPSRRALVIGINGSWGSGKTSLHYLITSALKSGDNANLFYVANFNPWFFSHAKSTASEFLKVVKSAIQTDDFVISGLIKKYADNILAGTEGLLLRTSFVKDWQSELSLEDELRRIRDRIRDLKKTLVVTIDDLDRLSAEELIEVFRLIRLVGDFPNTIYLLLYDREYVRGAISNNLSDYNSDIYIDKIIQVEYTIPEYNEDTLKQLFLKHLSKSIRSAIPESQRYWTEDQINELIKVEDFQFWIQHLRDIKRFSNNFLLRYKSIYRDVNFNHFFLLELLRYKFPEFVNIIFDSRSIFLTQFTKSDPFVNEIPITNSAFWSKVVKNENARNILISMVKFKDEKSSISEYFYFPNYFTLTLLDNYISEEAFSEVIGKTPSEGAENLFSKWADDNRSMLIYRFRNHDCSTIDDFIKYVHYLSYANHLMVSESDLLPSDDSKAQLLKIFTRRYQIVQAIEGIDPKTLYQKTSEFLNKLDIYSNRNLKDVFYNYIRYRINGDFGGSPLANGWKEALGRSVDHLNSIFSPTNDLSGVYMVFSAPFNFRFDYDTTKAAEYLRNIKVQIKRYPGENAFYIKLSVVKGDVIGEAFLQIWEQPTKGKLGKISDNEYSIGLPCEVKDGMMTFDFDIDQAFKTTLYAEGYELRSVSGFCVRGKIGFSYFELS